MRRITRTRQFWIVAAMLAVSAFLHYFTPQIRFPPLASFPLTRHAVERIIFILPIAGAAFAFGQVGGLITLALAVLIMLPRVFLISAYPMDSLVETIGVGVVSYLVIWMIETQESEKRLRQKVVEELETINAIAVTLSQSLDLNEILNMALGKVLEVMGPEAKGGIFLLDAKGQRLHMKAHQGLSPELVRQEAEIAAAKLNEELFDCDFLENALLTRGRKSDLCASIIVPLTSREKMQGVMFLHLQDAYQLDAEARRLFASIGSQIGVAVENARLYENLRFYVRQITRAQENERMRIARELHDDTAQALIALSRRLDDLATSDERLPESAVERLEKFQELIDSILQGVRRFSRDLRPSVLDDLGLLPALEGLMSDVKKDGIDTALQVHGDRRRLSPEAELVLFRIVQEALSNVRRHSQASQVVTVVEFGKDRVKITMEDNGQGFELPGRTGDLAAMGKLGLVGMYERAQLLDGTVAVQSELGRGTTVVVEMPA